MAPRTPKTEVKNRQVTTAEQWKLGRQPVKLLLPSGNVCLAINKGMQFFIERGDIPNSLMPIIQEAIADGTGGSPKKAQQIAATPEMLADSMRMMNLCVVECVVDPQIHMPPAEGEERFSHLLYADELDMEDKIFFFQWVVGGTSDIEQFRAQQTSAVADVQAGNEVWTEAQRDTGAG